MALLKQYSTENVLTAQKALTSFYSVWAPGDEDTELPHTEETVMNGLRFLYLLGVFSISLLKLVQSDNSATLAVRGRSSVINRNS